MTASQGICGRHLEAQVFCRECAEGIRAEGRVNGRNDREDDVTAAFARGRVAGIREAMAALESEYAHSKWPGGNFLDAIDTLKALLPPPSGGEKACFACAVSDTCPVHAPKPAAEKP